MSSSVPAAVVALIERWDSLGRPSRSETRWSRERWSVAFPEHRKVFDDLPEGLHRAAVRTAARDAPFDVDSATRAFLASMAWGYGPVGYGRWRTNRVLRQSSDAERRLLEVARCVAEEGGVAGYELLATSCRLRGLGPAFGTKYLYFLPVATGAEPALILDRLVAQWLRTHTSTVLNPVPWATATYRRYVETLSTWSADLEVAPDVLEERIFVSMIS